jgi:hypothetical protein
VGLRGSTCGNVVAEWPGGAGAGRRRSNHRRGRSVCPSDRVDGRSWRSQSVGRRWSRRWHVAPDELGVEAPGHTSSKRGSGMQRDRRERTQSRATTTRVSASAMAHGYVHNKHLCSCTLCCGQKPTGEQRRATQESREQLRAAAGPGPSERRPAKTPARTSDAVARACHLTYTWSGR